MLQVFANVIVPTILVASSGALLARWRGLEPGVLGPIAVYLLSPALVLDGLLSSELSPHVSFRVVAAASGSISLMVITAIVASMVIRGNRPLRSGFTLATAFANGGNMGIPVAFLAFGELGLAVAIIVFVTHATISWPVGIYIAAHGRANGAAALRQALQVPTIYAVPLALGMRAGGWSLPDPLSRPNELMGQAAVPVMLVLLGFQLAQGMDIARWRGIAASAAIRLVLSAGVAFVATEVAGLEGTAQHTVIVVSAMPTAVFTTILAAEFDAEPRFVSSAMVFSTLVSLVTLTALITLLGWWV